MKRIECLNHCQFLHDGCSDIRLISILYNWYEYCLEESCTWIIVVITQAAGRGGGKNIDIYKFSPDIQKEDLRELLTGDDFREVVVIFDCFNESFEVFINKIVHLRGAH